MQDMGIFCIIFLIIWNTLCLVALHQELISEVYMYIWCMNINVYEEDMGACLRALAAC